MDAFNNIYEDPQGIIIKQVYDSPMDYDKYIEVASEGDYPETFAKYLEVTKDAENITHLYERDSLELDGLQIKVFSSWGSVVLENVTENIPNNASLVFKIYFMPDMFSWGTMETIHFQPISTIM